MRPKFPRTSLPLLLALTLATACQFSVQKRDWTKYDGPGKEHFLKEEVEFRPDEDPIEAFNRGTGAFNHVLMVGIFTPLGWVYGFVPEPARDGVENVFTNLFYPVRLVSNVFQWKWGGAWTETKRFAVNTTAGVLGIWDRASDWDIGRSNEDVGQTLGKWGWKNSTFFMVPVLGPATVRDGIGLIGDAALDPLTYYPPATPVRSATRLANSIDTYKTFVATNYDPYALGRLLYLVYRTNSIEDYRYEAPADESGETETLQSVFLTNEDEDFPGKRETHSVLLPSTGEKLSYSLWLAPGERPLVYFIPGTGGHRLGGSSMGVAEVVHENGNSVITISSSFNHEFISDGSTVAFPGFAPADASDTHVALDAIDRDVRERYPDRFTDRRLVGLSLGAMQTLHIAAQAAEPTNELIDFDAYLALNSPVSLRYAVGRLDECFNVPLVFPEEERLHEVRGIIRKVIDLAQGSLQPGKPLPFSELESEFLIGLSFRLQLSDVIYQTTLRHPMGVLQTERTKWRRNAAYQEIREYSFMEYFYAWALPYFAETRDDIDFTDAGADRLFDLCDLRSIETALRERDDVLYFSNENDFLMRPEDVAWVRSTFGERCYFFETGGHLGNLYRSDVQLAIRDKARAMLGIEE